MSADPHGSGYFSLDESSSEERPQYDESFLLENVEQHENINLKKLVFYGDDIDNSLGFWIKDLPYILCSFNKNIYRIYFSWSENFDRYVIFNDQTENIRCFIEGCTSTVKYLLLQLNKYGFVTFQKFSDEYRVMAEHVRRNGKKCDMNSHDFFVDPYKLQIFDPINKLTKTISTMFDYDLFKQFENDEMMYENMSHSNIVTGYASSPTKGLLFRMEFNFDENKVELIGIANFVNEDVDKKFKAFLLQFLIRELYKQFAKAYRSKKSDKLFKNIIRQSAKINEVINKILLDSFKNASNTIYEIFNNKLILNPYTVIFLLNINGRYFFVATGKKNNVFMIQNKNDINKEINENLQDEITYISSSQSGKWLQKGGRLEWSGKGFKLYDSIGEMEVGEHDEIKFKMAAGQNLSHRHSDISIYIFSTLTIEQRNGIGDIIKKYHKQYRKGGMVDKITEQYKNLSVVHLELLTKNI